MTSLQQRAPCSEERDLPHFADLCQGMWHRGIKLSAVAGTEVLEVAFQVSMLIFPGKGYTVNVEVVLCLQAFQWHIWIFS